MHSTLEAMLLSGQYTLAAAAGEQWFSENPAPDPHEAALIAWLCARACAWLNAWNDTLRWVRRGQACGSHDVFIRGKLHLLAGTALMFRDLRQSECEFDGFDRAVKMEPRLCGLIGDVLYNRAYAKRLWMELPAEVALFEAAAHAYREQGRLGRADVCLFEAGWSWLLANRIDQAEPMLKAAHAGLGKQFDSDSELGWDLSIAEALGLRLLGSLSQSNDVCHRLAASHVLLPRQAADVAWIAGSNALDLGAWHDAEHFATLAKRLAVALYWPPQVRRNEELYARVMRARGAEV